MKNNLDIRKATLADAENVSQFICRLSKKYITPEFSAEGQKCLLESMTPDAIRQYMQTGYRYRVVEAHGKLIGVVAIKDNSHLYHLFVDDEHHQKGIAGSLWQAAMEDCLSRGNPGEFTVNSSSYALGVYKRFGFIIQGVPELKDGVIYTPMKLDIRRQDAF